MATTLDARLEALKATTEAFVNNIKDEARPFTPDEQTAFDAMIADGKALTAAIGGHAEADAAIQAMRDRPAPSDEPVAAGSHGEQFVNSEQWTAFRAQFPNGIPASSTASSGSVRVGSFRNAVLVDPNLTPTRHVIDAPTGVNSMELMEIITVIDDAPQLIKHFTAAFTNAAEVTVESTGPGVGVKPESSLVWTPRDLAQAVVAHHIPISVQALNHNPMLMQIIDQFMVNGVRAKVQARIAAQLAAWAGLVPGAFTTDYRITLRKAVTTAQVQGAILGSGPISIIVSALDAETLDLELLDSVQLAPGQAPQQAQNIWRTNLVVVPPMPSGFAYVGDMRNVIWYTSGGIDVSVGMIDDQYIRNQRTILAETEGVTGVLNAAAIVKADLTV